MDETPAALTRAAEVPAGRKIGALPGGPVRLRVLVFAVDGELMGSAPAGEPRWLWRAGSLCVSYTPVRVVMARPGRYATGLICAVSPQTGTYQPLWPVSLGEPGELRAGDDLTIADGVIAITPELPGPHG